jgi:hypothetical protein
VLAGRPSSAGAGARRGQQRPRPPSLARPPPLAAHPPPRLARPPQRNEGIDLRKDRQALQRLTEAAEKAKIELSGTTQTNINLPFITATADGPKHIDTTLTKGARACPAAGLPGAPAPCPPLRPLCRLLHPPAAQQAGHGRCA